MLDGISRIRTSFTLPRRATAPPVNFDAPQNPDRVELGSAPEPLRPVPAEPPAPPAVDPARLGALWEACQPGSHAAVSVTADPKHGAVMASIHLRDGTARPIASIMRVYRSHPDGSLELNLASIEVEREHREQGLVPRSVLAQLADLRERSDHPDSRITLRASGFTPGVAKRTYGNYVWASYGLWEFSKPECLPEQQAAYARWVDGQPGLSPDLRSQLKDLSRSWQHPHDIATTSLPGLTFPVSLDGGPPRACEAGKAYLLSEEAPAWYGVCYVNRPPTRQALAGLAGLEAKLARVDRAAEQQDRRWEAGLPATLPEIARQGGSHWLPRLEAMGEAGQEAASILRGERLPELLVRQFADPALPEGERGEAFQFYFQRRGPLTDEVLRCWQAARPR